MIRVIKGLHPDEVMREYRVNGKKVAYRNRQSTPSPWYPCDHPAWDWGSVEYAIIDDTEPTVDFSEFNWDFLSQYGGLPIRFHRDPIGVYHISRIPREPQGIVLVETPWYMWRGGKCPVPSNAQVHCILRDNTEIFFRASGVSWDHSVTQEDAQVIGFRLTGIIY